MASWTIPPLWIHRLPRSHRNNSRHRPPIPASHRSLLSVHLGILPVRVLLHILLDLRYLLVHPVPILALEMGHGAKILGARMGVRRPSILHPPGTIRTGRDHQRPVRPDDARPPTAQPGPLTRPSLGEAKISQSLLSRASLEHFFSSIVVFFPVNYLSTPRGVSDSRGTPHGI